MDRICVLLRRNGPLSSAHCKCFSNMRANVAECPTTAIDRSGLSRMKLRYARMRASIASKVSRSPQSTEAAECAQEEARMHVTSRASSQNMVPTSITYPIHHPRAECIQAQRWKRVAYTENTDTTCAAILVGVCHEREIHTSELWLKFRYWPPVVARVSAVAFAEILECHKGDVSLEPQA